MTLNLEKNSLTLLYSGMFNGLFNIINLNLSDNYLKLIDPILFKDVVQFDNFSVVNNKLSAESLEQLRDSVKAMSSLLV